MAINMTFLTNVLLILLLARALDIRGATTLAPTWLSILMGSMIIDCGYYVLTQPIRTAEKNLLEWSAREFLSFFFCDDFPSKKKLFRFAH
jgi:hypothetical protein